MFLVLEWIVDLLGDGKILLDTCDCFPIVGFVVVDLLPIQRLVWFLKLGRKHEVDPPQKAIHPT